MRIDHQTFDRLIKALIALKAAYMRERDPKRSCQIYVTGYRIAMRLLVNSDDNSAMGLRGFFQDHDRSSTCHYLLKLWNGEDPWNPTPKLRKPSKATDRPEGVKQKGSSSPANFNPTR